MSFEIITDSSAKLPEEFIEQEQIQVLSLSFFVNGKEYFGYEKGKKTDLAPFYSMMRMKKDIRTSLVNTALAREMAGQVLSEGKDILYIGFSSGLSGTYQSVSIVLNDLKILYPERKIYTIDSLSAALGEGMLVYFAAMQKKEGKTIEEVYQWLIENRCNICHWFTVDDLFFLQRGGRISGKNAWVGTALHIKPVMHVNEEGQLEMVEKVRGRKKALEALIDRYEKDAIDPGKYPVFLNHGDCMKDAEYVMERIKERFGVSECMIRVWEPIVGAHAGPGTIALFFYGKSR